MEKLATKEKIYGKFLEYLLTITLELNVIWPKKNYT